MAASGSTVTSTIRPVNYFDGILNATAGAGGTMYHQWETVTTGGETASGVEALADWRIVRCDQRVGRDLELFVPMACLAGSYSGNVTVAAARRHQRRRQVSRNFAAPILRRRRDHH